MFLVLSSICLSATMVKVELLRGGETQLTNTHMRVRELGWWLKLACLFKSWLFIFGGMVAPGSFLARLVGQRVSVEVKFLNSTMVVGRLVYADPGTMNMVLEEAEEWVDGKPSIRYGLVILRGSMVSTVRVVR